MKNTIFILCLSVLALMSCNSKSTEDRISELEGKANTPPKEVAAQPASPTETKPEGPLPVMSFTEDFHDFGTITEGDVVTHVYKFKNTGDAPLIIQGAQGSCGCTIPEWTKGEIPVGGEGTITAKFNSAGKHELQKKSITVTANTWPAQTIVKFEAMVLPKNEPVQ